MTLQNYEYLQPELMPLLDQILNRENISVGQSLMSEVKDLFKFLETKLRTSSTIREFRQVTDAYQWLFLVDPYPKDWYDQSMYSTSSLLTKSYEIPISELNALYRFFSGNNPVLYADNVNEPYQEISNEDRYITFYRDISNINEFDYVIPEEYVVTINTTFPAGTSLGCEITYNRNVNPVLYEIDDNITTILVHAMKDGKPVFQFRIRLTEYGEFNYLAVNQFFGDPNDTGWEFDDIVLSADYGTGNYPDGCKELNFNFKVYKLYNETKDIVDVGEVLNPNKNVLDVYPDFSDIRFYRAFLRALDRWECKSIFNSSLSPLLKTEYKNIITDKIMLDISNTQYGPRTFEAL